MKKTKLRLPKPQTLVEGFHFPVFDLVLAHLECLPKRDLLFPRIRNACELPRCRSQVLSKQMTIIPGQIVKKYRYKLWHFVLQVTLVMCCAPVFSGKVAVIPNLVLTKRTLTQPALRGLLVIFLSSFVKTICFIR